MTQSFLGVLEQDVQERELCVSVPIVGRPIVCIDKEGTDKEETERYLA